MTTIKPRAGIRLSVAEFLDLPDTDDRRKMELDDGELYIMPRPRLGHNFLSFWLSWHIANYLNSFPEPPAVFFQDVSISLFPELTQLFAPDLVIVLKGRESILGDRMVEGAPDIVVEILSDDRNRDLVRKRQLYAAAGVREYWIVDPAADSVTLLALDGGDYVERAALTAADTLTTPLLPGLAIPLADVFHHRQRPQGDDE